MGTSRSSVEALGLESNRNSTHAIVLMFFFIFCSTIPDQGIDELQHELPKGIWLRFDFDDSHPDLPTLYS
ncbi:hypothetical protein GH714_023894 [Hevea brasiliensis]|uniref:Uncharacterized protein n=1 Tax=Hevea brasiliensis TaxID=3981 RepID=A0A6A6M9L1_HEVBR|nr:hypothetical protein GH714_023894 [Hevea brasiliensis]